MDVKLVMFKADGTRREFTLSRARTVIGRTNTADLRIPLSSVSRQHCEITVIDGRIRVRDMGSSNGTHHNGTRIQEAELSAGDKIIVGPVVFTVVIDGQPAEIEPVRTVLDEEETAVQNADSGPKPLETDEEDLPLEVDAEHYTPTVDLDDPLAALQKLSAETDEMGTTTDNRKTGSTASQVDDADEDIPLLADEDDDDLPILADEDDDT